MAAAGCAAAAGNPLSERSQEDLSPQGVAEDRCLDVPLHVLVNWMTNFELLKKSLKKVARQSREPADRESVLGAGEMEDGDLVKSRSSSRSRRT